MGSEGWQGNSSSVAAGSEEGCCLTPWCFVGDAVGEIRADRYHTGGEGARAFTGAHSPCRFRF